MPYQVFNSHASQYDAWYDTEVGRNADPVIQCRAYCSGGGQRKVIEKTLEPEI